jgi:hypothetical protein
MSKIIAWYLPQFHRVEENDRWWGDGFTEWDSIRKWKPCFPGHEIHRPHKDIGYYNLLDVGTRRFQGEIAKKYGVYGFCYYHYWFAGKLLLQKPLELMLSDGEPNLPFCLSWANEPWRRTWHIRSRDNLLEILQEQTYGGQEEWERHLQYLLPFFRHRNYIKVDNKPMMVVYGLGQIPNYQKRFDYWRERLQQEGFAGLHLVMTLNHKNLKPLPGIDAVAELQPDFVDYAYRSVPKKLIASFLSPVRRYRWYLKLRRTLCDIWGVGVTAGAEIYKKIIKIPALHKHHYRGAFSGWDCSPRAGNLTNIYTLPPEMFGEYLGIQKKQSPEFLFINAWNEWGEGAVLEPDERSGYGYLEAVAKVSADKAESKPNLFIVGMPRAGTTSLYKYLGAHPEIFMPDDKKCKWFRGKEPHFFGSDLIPSYRAPARLTRSEYLALFKSAHQKIRGEASVNYLMSTKAPEEIYAFNPDSKIIISLRNPIDQCYSLYNLLSGSIDQKHVLNFEYAMEEENVAIAPQGWFTEEIFYKKNIKNLPMNIRRYQNQFGKDNVKIIIFDDLKQAPAKVYKEMLEFLGVDTHFAPDFIPYHANMAFQYPRLLPLYRKLQSFKWLFTIKRLLFPQMDMSSLLYKKATASEISPELRRKLLEEFVPVIEELEKITGRDLSDWKR